MMGKRLRRLAPAILQLSSLAAAASAAPRPGLGDGLPPAGDAGGDESAASRFEAARDGRPDPADGPPRRRRRRLGSGGQRHGGLSSVLSGILADDAGPPPSPSSPRGTRPPTGKPTGQPTGEPSAGGRPSRGPTGGPTPGPTGEPTSEPTSEPSGGPTGEPSGRPSSEPPTAPPTAYPSESPTTLSPSFSPTDRPTSPPTGDPTTSSPTPLRYCPPPYDQDAPYRAGDEIEVGGYVFACRDAPHEAYCGVPVWDDSLLDGDEDAEEHWRESWSLESACRRTGTPTWAPTPLRYCPPPYDRGADYAAGDEVEVNGRVFACRDAPYEAYCSVPSWDDALLFLDGDARELWAMAWRPGAGCYRTGAPSGEPSYGPTSVPSLAASGRPSPAASDAPSLAASDAPSQAPSLAESDGPSLGPSVLPSPSPSLEPSSAPSGHPSVSIWPTGTPSGSPSASARPSTSAAPSLLPSDHPSVSIWPTGKPSSTPSVAPSEMPSWTPSSDPTESPTMFPTVTPSKDPTRFPSQSPVSRCPPSYDKTRTDYAAGDRVEIFSTIYECKEFPYQPYCNIADESVLRKYEKDYWNDAWSLIGPCDDSFPSKSPSYAPTSVEHAVSVGIIRKWYPDLFVDENLCRYDDYYPLWMSFDSNKEDYLFDSRDECCSQFPCETASPTSEPSTIEPSRQPTESPTESPTEMPSARPSRSPSRSPSSGPTNSPSTSPSLSPTNSPSSNPTASPSSDLAPIIRPFQNGRGVLGAFGEDIVLFCEAFDPEGHELTYQWGVNCGTGAEFIENEDTNRPTLRIPQGLDPGSTCEFTVSVCDRPNRCTSENGSIAILNSDPEASCVVNATVEATDESCSAFAEVDFGSSDADGSILERTYEPAGPYQVTGDETTYDVILTVLDAHGEIDSCSAQVTVTNAAPQVQLEDVFFVYLNGETDDTEENGNLSVTATDDQTLSYQWSLDERCDTDEVSISGADTNFPHVTILENSDMKVCGVSCRVCDSCGACSESSASIIARRSPTPSPNTPTSAPSTTVSEIPSFAESNKPSSKSDQPSLASSNVPSLARSTFPSLLKSESPSLTISELPSLFGSTLSSNPPSVMPSSMPLKMPGEIPTLRLSAHPTQMQQPTSSPSHEELDLVGICPDAYDATKTSSYSAGSLVEVMQIVYKCQEYPYAHFCTLESFAPQSNQSLWRDAWAEVGVCVRVPSLSPTDLPSSTPITNKATRTPTNLPSSAPITINPTRGPSELPTFAPITNKPTRRPTRRPSANPSLSPTTHMPSGNPTPDQEWLELVSKFPYTWPHRRFKYWIELDGDDRLTARKQLGYSRNTWNNLQTAVVESKIFVDLEESEQVGLNMLDISADQWDCFMNHYSGIYWEDLVKKDVARYYEVLGWNQEWWDNGTGQPETEDVYWDGLTPDQQEAAYKLCYFEKSWEWLELSSW